MPHLKLVTDADEEAAMNDPVIIAAVQKTARRLKRLGIMDPAPVHESGALLLHPDGKVAVAAYRHIATEARQLTPTEWRVLCALLAFADTGSKSTLPFINCFPRRTTLLQRLGGRTKSIRALSARLTSLERKGWIERLQSLGHRGRFGCAGYRFRIPPGVITPTDPGWEGPKQFDRFHTEGWRTRRSTR